VNDAHEMSTMLGAYVLDILDPGERRAVDEHLTGCAHCRAELAELNDTAALLDSVPADLAAVDTSATDDLVLQRTLRAMRSERSSGRLQRLTSVAASVVGLVVVSAAVGVAVGRGTAPGPGPQAVPTATISTPAGVRQLTQVNPATGAGMVATVTPAKGWVRLKVKVTGVAEGERCKLIAVSSRGSREIAGSWVVSATGASEGTAVDGAAAVPLEDLAALEVVTFDDNRLVSVAV
jgi:anti-sigma factor RsiW